MTIQRPIVSDASWCSNIAAPGELLQGAKCIGQRIFLVLSTPKGADPMRPWFGTNIPSMVDRSNISVAGQIKADIIDAISVCVPEVVLQSVKYKYTDNGLEYTIAGSYKGSTIEPVLFTIGYGDSIPIVVCEIPDLPLLTIANYRATLSVDFGVPLVLGDYADVPLLLQNVRSSWGIYGTWGSDNTILALYGKSSFTHFDLTVELV